MRRVGLDWRRRLVGARARLARRASISSRPWRRDGQRFEGRRAAVTGAGGFIGGAICRAAGRRGREVPGLDLDPAAAGRVSATGAALRRGRRHRPRGARARALEGADLVVHTAAHVRDWGAMEDFVRVNVGGTANGARRGRGRPAPSASSTSARSSSTATTTPREQDETAFRRTYGIPYIDTKSASDRLACRRGAVVDPPGRRLRAGLGAVDAAPARAGAGGAAGRARPRRRADAARSTSTTSSRRSSSAWIDGEPGEAYTAWDDEPGSPSRSYFNRLARIAGGPRGASPAAPGARAGGAGDGARGRSRAASRPPFTARAVTFIDRRGTVSAAKAREELGWEPRVSFDEGMRRTEEWLRAEGLL